MKEVNKRYTIPQEILYSVCLAAWKLCRSNLGEFAGLKGYYTEAFIADAMEAVMKARQLPDLGQTLAARTEARINLIDAARPVMGNWQLLKRYITAAYDKDIVGIKLQAAGDSLYKKATLYNWSAVLSLVDTANTFIANNLDALTANGNMPVSFQTNFRTAGDKCLALSTSFSWVKIHKEMYTQRKINANNAIYASVIEMLKDGQQIFKNDLTLKKQFTFNYLVSIHRGEGSASLKGYIVNSLNLPVEGAVIVSQDLKYTATTDSKGYYRINRIAAGTYTFSVICPGYELLMQTITFATATASKGDFTIPNVMLKVA